MLYRATKHADIGGETSLVIAEPQTILKVDLKAWLCHVASRQKNYIDCGFCFKLWHS